MRDLPGAAFPLAEYARRLASVRERLVASGFDQLLLTSPENIYYLSGYDSVGYFALQALIVPQTGEPALVVRELEVGNAAASCVFDRVVLYGDQDVATDIIADVIAELGGRWSRIGLELRSRSLSAAQLASLRERLPSATFADCFGAVEGARLIKSDGELAYIREAGAIADVGMRACLAAVACGVRESDLAALAYNTIVRAGSEWTGAPPFISSGPRSARAHITWSDRAIEAGDPIFLEINVARRRYHAALMRSTCEPPIAARYRAMCEASRAGLEAALHAAHPGARAADIDRACRGAIERHGLADQFRLRTGYSIGIGFENFAEGALLSLHSNSDAVIQSGMVLHLVPYLADMSLGGCAFSETVIVSMSGAEALSTVSRDL